METSGKQNYSERRKNDVESFSNSFVSFFAFRPSIFRRPVVPALLLLRPFGAAATRRSEGLKWLNKLPGERWSADAAARAE